MCFLARILAFIPFGNVLRGTFGKMIIGAGIISLLFIGATIWLKTHDAKIAKNATLSFNNAQLTQTVNDNARFAKQINDITASQTILLSSVDAWRKAIEKQNHDITYSIGKFPTTQSSPVLKETITRLSNRSKK